MKEDLEVWSLLFSCNNDLQLQSHNYSIVVLIKKYLRNLIGMRADNGKRQFDSSYWLTSSRSHVVHKLYDMGPVVHKRQNTVIVVSFLKTTITVFYRSLSVL